VRSGARTDLPGHTDQICSSACSPDGRRLLTAGNAGSLRIWAAGAKTGDAPLKVMASPGGAPRQVSWSADDQAVLVAAKAGTAILTTDDKATAPLSIVRLDDLLKAACALATRPFTPAEWALYFPDETYRPPLCGSALTAGRCL
jgi:WD40 repeat protein